MGWHLQSWEFIADVQCHSSSLEDSITHGKVILGEISCGFSVPGVSWGGGYSNLLEVRREV